MAIIPRSDPSAIKTIAPLPRARNEVQVSAAPVQGMADAVRSTVGEVENVYRKMQERADVSAVMEGERQLSEWQNGWTDPNNEAGMNAYKGKDALGLRDKMMGDYDKRVSEIDLRLPSPRARERFRQFATAERARIGGQINDYANRQHADYIAGERKAFENTRITDLSNAVLRGDTAAAAELWADTQQTMYADGAADGRPPEETAWRIRALESGMHASVLDNLIASDPVAAERYFEANIDKLLPEHRAAANRAVVPVLDDQQSDAIVDSIIDGMPMPEAGMGVSDPGDGQAPPKVPPKIHDIIVSAADRYGVPRNIALAMAEQESKFNPLAVGPPTQYGRAGGLFQFIEATAASKGIDRMDPAQAADAAMQDLAREGKAKGWAWAIAHHHAGPNPAQHGPKTRKYTSEVMQKARRYNTDAVPVERMPPTNLGEALEQVRRIENPRLRARVESKLRDAYALMTAQREAAEQQAAAGIYDKVVGAAPNVPLRGVLTPQELAYLGQNATLSASIDRYRKLTLEGKVIDDDPALVDQFARMRATDPEAFRTVKLAEFADRLSGKTLLELTKAQAEAKKPEARARWATEDQQLSLAFDTMGLGGGKEDAAHRGNFRRAYVIAKRSFVEQHKREPNADETQGMLNKLMLPFVKSGFLGFGGGTRRAYEGAAPGYEVPEAERVKIVAALKRNGIANPTEADIVGVYVRGAGDRL